MLTFIFRISRWLLPFIVFSFFSDASDAQTGPLQASVNGLTITYEQFGPDNGETILLIAGLGTQLTMWHDELCEKLAEHGYRVIRFDNRDAGLSTHLDDLGRPNWEAIGTAAYLGESPPLPYSLKDMAEDAAGLLDAIGIERAHIVGASMGGGIAQLVAINHPHRVLSLTSIFSDTGNPEMQGPSEEVMAIPPSPPAGSNIEAIIERELTVWEIIGSPDYPVDKGVLREWIIRDTERSYNPVGVERQAAAVMFAGDRRDGLRKLNIPVMIIHGDADILVPVENAYDLEENIPDAELRIIEGMGHDIPMELIEEFTDAIITAAERASE